MRKVGEEVIIREDLIEGNYYGEDGVVEEMMEYLGEKATITTAMNYGYLIDIDPIGWTWTDEMFEK